MKKIIATFLFVLVSIAAFSQDRVVVEHVSETSRIFVEIEIDCYENLEFDSSDSTTIQEQAMEIARLKVENRILESENGFLRAEKIGLENLGNRLLSNNEIMAETLFNLRHYTIDLMKVMLPSGECLLDIMLEEVDEGLAKRIEVE